MTVGPELPREVAPVEAAELRRDEAWRRLDSRMLLVHPVNEVVRFLPALIGVFLIGSSGPDTGRWHLIALAVPVTLGILRFLTTSFRITPGQLELRRGLLSRNVLTAPLDRIRTVELTASPIHRVLGLSRVQIGTGSAVKRGDDKFVLDSLATTEARTLRAALLHRVGAPAGAGSAAAVPSGPTDEVLLRLNPWWVRYAPMTTGGLVIGLGALAAGNQLIAPVVRGLTSDTSLGDRAAEAPLAVTILIGVLAVLIAITVLSMIGYVSTNWGFTLIRDLAGRSFHVRRGLLTNHETSLETQRIRGIEVHEPLGLRLVGARRLAAIVTGLTRREAGSTVLVPPAPRAVVSRVAALVIADPEPLTTTLISHGPAARRRRYIRSIGTAAVLAAAYVLTAALAGWPAPSYAVAALPLLAGVLLARDRYARLGHALTGRYLVVRRNSLAGRRDVLERDGIIGWNVHESWFQRRVGVLTLVATTSAGKQGYRIPDLPVAEGTALATAAVPGLLEPFLAEPAQTIRR